MVHEHHDFPHNLATNSITALALEAARLGAWEVSTAGIVNWDKRTREIHSIDENAHLSLKDTEAVVHPDDLALVRHAIAEASLPGGRGYYDVQYRLNTDAPTRWVGSFARVVKNSDDVIVFRGVVQDITEHKHTEELRELLLHELNHRTKNILIIVASLARKTLQNAGACSLKTFEGRLQALGRSQAALMTAEGRCSAPIRKVVSQAVAPFTGARPHCVKAQGSNIELSSDKVMTLSLVLHELLTNAVKYGALSNERGVVDLRWRTVSPHGAIEITWQEHGGPPVKPSGASGFGTQLICGLLNYGADAAENVRIEYLPRGVRCSFRLQ